MLHFEAPASRGPLICQSREGEGVGDRREGREGREGRESTMSGGGGSGRDARCHAPNVRAQGNGIYRAC